MALFQRQFYLYSTPQVHPLGVFLIAVLVLTVFTATGLIGVWTGLGKPHWFFRFSLAVAVVAFPLTIPAYELAIVFFAQIAVTTLPLLILRRFRGNEIAVVETPGSVVPPNKTQFFLRDLLLLAVIVALVSSIFSRVPHEIWKDWLDLSIAGFALGVLTLIGTWVALGRTRLWLRLIVLLLFLPSALIAFILGLVRADRRCRDATTQHPAARLGPKAALFILALAILIPPAYFYPKLLIRSPIPEEPIPPDQNSYRELCQIPKTLASVSVPQEDDSLELHRAFVRVHQGFLDRTHAALQRLCQFPLPDDFASLPDYAELRQIARAVEAEGRLARNEGRDADAIRAFLDELRLDNAVSHGTLITDSLVGVAISDIGVARLAEMRVSMSSDQCREIIAALQEIEGRRESIDAVLARDEAWTAKACSISVWQLRLLYTVVHLQGNDVPSVFAVAMKRDAAKRQLLQAELALRCYQLERSKPAESLADLVPAYLPAIPQDPFSDSPLIYRKTPSGWLLYSLGPDQKDDGGQAPAPNTNGHGDLLLDKPKENETKT
jgi:hypothetical protein